jgi:sucrose phosphorylase
LITYANTVADDAAFGLQSLRGLVNRHLEPFARVIHVLPFLKSTSDGGFAVSSYQKIEQEYGDWSDLSALAEGRRLMADLVLNHVSASHPWVPAVPPKRAAWRIMCAGSESRSLLERCGSSA